MTMPAKRFTTVTQGRYVLVVDGETGAKWPYLDQVTADSAAAASNDDPTYLRDGGQTAVPPTIA